MTMALVATAVLLLIGLLLRLSVPWFRWLYIPASVIAGIVGLVLVQLSQRIFTDNGTLPSTAVSDVTAQWSGWPGWLIAVVFAAMLLEKKQGNTRASIRRTFSQVVMVWVIVVGQTAVGLLITWLLVQPFYDVPNSFGVLIETGFAGGHGTAAAMGLVFDHPSIALQSGLELGILMATAGLIYGVISGITWINIAVRIGAVKIEHEPASDKSIVIAPDAQTPIGYQVLSRDVIDPLLLQMIWLTLATGIGVFLHWGIGEAASQLDASQVVAAEVGAENLAENQLGKRLTFAETIGNFPLFIYTLLGGWVVRRILVLGNRKSWIDSESIRRLSAVAMDVLVVAAIASLNLSAVVQLIVPFSLLLLGGMIWTGICLMFLSRRILPSSHWFQLGLINYGMSTGTTATGFVLLRIVDPELKTQAAEDYALAAPFSSPFIGGGMITIGLPLLFLERFPIGLSTLAAVAIVVALMIVGIKTRSES
jgi:ESS family glutamate:Na+ symporter